MNIKVTDLSYRYGDKEVLSHFSMEMQEGKRYSLMGPSGSGKTTLLKLLAGLLTAKEGRISGLEDKTVSMVFQEDRLCENESALTNVLMVCSGRRAREDAERELLAVGLDECGTQPVRELSGGMRRRVVLARALIAAYDLLLLDEPFQGLDEESKKKLMDYLLVRTNGKTVLMVTHEKDDADNLGGEIIECNFSQ